MTDIPATGTTHTERKMSPLGASDIAALRDTHVNLSDVDNGTRTRAHAGFRHAYDVAQRVLDGRADPLSV